MFINERRCHNRLSVTKINYTAIHEVSHFLAAIIFLIESSKTKEQIREVIKEISIYDKSKEDDSLGHVLLQTALIDNLEGAEFIWISGCVGSYYYYIGTSKITELDYCTSSEIREFMMKTGGEYDLQESKLKDPSLITNYKLKKLVKKLRKWYNDMEFIELVTSLAKLLKRKKSIKGKDLNNIINSNYSFLKEKTEYLNSSLIHRLIS